MTNVLIISSFDTLIVVNLIYDISLKTACSIKSFFIFYDSYIDPYALLLPQMNINISNALCISSEKVPVRKLITIG